MGKKSIKKNYIYNLMYQMLIIFVPLITTPYVSKTLGSEMIGIYSYTLSIATYFILFGTLGIAMYAQREIAYVQDDKKKISVIFWEVIILRIITMAISATIYYFTMINGTQYQIYYKVLLLEILANCIDISWLFQGLEEFKKTVIRNSVIKIISVISIFVFVKTRDDLIKYFFIYMLSNLIGNLSLWLYLPKYLVKINLKQLNLKRHIKPTIQLFIPQIAIQIYTVLDKTMIGKMISDKSEVGYYEQSQKIIKTALTVITSLGTVMSPRIAYVSSNNRKDEVEKYLANSFKFVWLLGIPIMLGLMAISSSLVPWFLGEEFIKAKWIIIFGAPLTISIGLNNVSGIQYLIQTKKQKIFTKSVVIGALCNFTLNLILIHFIKSYGAIIASVIAETLILMVQLKYMRQEIALKIVYNKSLKYIVSGIIMFVLILPIGILNKPTVVTTALQILIGGIIYISLLLIQKDDFLFENVKKIKDKILGVKNEENKKIGKKTSN